MRQEAGVLLVWSAAALAVLALMVPHTSVKPGGVPLGLDAALDRLPAGTAVFNDYDLGGWLTWRHPDLDQYVDGLATPYSAAHVAAYARAAVSAASGAYRIVRRSGAGAALLRQDSPHVEVLRNKGWTTEGTDACYVLLEPAS